MEYKSLLPIIKTSINLLGINNYNLVKKHIRDIILPTLGGKTDGESVWMTLYADFLTHFDTETHGEYLKYVDTIPSWLQNKIYPSYSSAPGIQKKYVYQRWVLP